MDVGAVWTAITILPTIEEPCGELGFEAADAKRWQSTSERRAFLLQR